MFQTNHQKQPPIKNTKIIKTVGTNNEGNRQEYKPHVKNNPKQLIIIKKQKHMDKNNNKDVQTTLARNQNAKDILETQTNAKMFKLVWLGAHGQTSLKICVVICVVFPMFFCLLILSQKCLKIFVFVFLFLFPMCFCCFLYVPFMCGIGWDSPDPKAPACCRGGTCGSRRTARHLTKKERRRGDDTVGSPHRAQNYRL